MARDVGAGRSLVPIEERLLSAIEAAGLRTDGGVVPHDLGALDHFHTGGRRASVELLELAEFGADARVLDLGAGTGGAARLIASARGSRVMCLEPSADYCRALRLLNRVTGLDDRIGIRQGAAPPLPFEDSSFAVVWMQNVGMCIRDKEALYAEVRRVLQPGGRFVFQEVTAGSGGEPYYPLPWARDASMSFLLSNEQLGACLSGAGLIEERFEDASEAELSRSPAGAAEGPLTFAVYVDDVPIKTRNSRRSMAEGRVRFVKGVFRAP